MNDHQIATVKECAALSAAGKIHFGQVVARLTAADIERYHADYTRHETAYYAHDGRSYVVPMAHDPLPIAREFSPAGVESAVRQSQRGQIMYPEFTRQATAAGCVGYFVQLTGKRVQYFGRNGDVHTESFPDAKRP